MKDVGFEIDGVFHEMPLLGSFDLDENRVFKLRTGMHAEEVWLGLQDGADLSFAELLRNDGFLEALVHIAYRRANEGTTDDEIQRRVGKMNRLDLFSSLITSMIEEEAEEEPVPLGSGTTSDPNGSSTSSPPGKPGTKPSKEKRSGKRSAKSSDQQDDGLGSIGITGSDTPSVSGQLRRVV